MSGTSHSNKTYRCLICYGVFAREGITRGRKSYCAQCTGTKVVLQMAAYKAVRQAISKGRLPIPWTQKCVDCGNTARIFDHRNYDRPLEVEPVCTICNQRRGPAIWPKSATHTPAHPAPQATNPSVSAPSAPSPQRVGQRREAT